MVEPLQVSRLPVAVRLAVAKLQGEADRWTTGDLGGRPLEEAVAALQAISRDPIALGVVLGVMRARIELDGQAEYGRAVEALQLAGADEDTGERMLAAVRRSHR